MKRMSDVTEVSGWKYVEPEEDPEGTLMNVPKNTAVYEISGPMFFGAADKLLKIAVKENAKCLIFSHVASQPLSIMHKAGFYDKIGEANFCAHINDAIKRAQDLQ